MNDSRTCPPRFVDVVKRRLELSIEFLASGAQDDRSYEIESGLRIRYTQQELVDFLNRLYSALFDRRRNISKVLEALAGKDVRRALMMFVSIFTSGHLSTTVIASNTLGGAMQFKEHTILKILMRTNRRIFSKDSGFIQNIFSYFSDSPGRPAYTRSASCECLSCRKSSLTGPSTSDLQMAEHRGTAVSECVPTDSLPYPCLYWGQLIPCPTSAGYAQDVPRRCTPRSRYQATQLSADFQE
jgi:hypothetical protein